MPYNLVSVWAHSAQTYEGGLGGLDNLSPDEAYDSASSKARNELMHDPLRTQNSRTRPGWGSCYACLLTVHSGWSNRRLSLLACISAVRQSQIPTPPFVNEGAPLFSEIARAGCVSWCLCLLQVAPLGWKNAVFCWLACCGLNITGVWTEMVEFLCMCSNQLGQDGAQTT
jgi:hypothetical protein